MTAAFEEALDRGIERFNRGDYWHAHEEWESIWLSERGEARDFLQGLIQLAAAWYHTERGNFRGAARLSEAALRRLGRYPANYLGVDRSSAIAPPLDEASAPTEPLPQPKPFLSRSGELGRDFRKPEK